MFDISEVQASFREKFSRKTQKIETPPEPVAQSTVSVESADLYKPSEFKDRLATLFSDLTARNDLDVKRMAGYIERIVKQLGIPEIVKMQILEMDQDRSKWTAQHELEYVRSRQKDYVAFKGRTDISPHVMAAWIKDSEKSGSLNWAWKNISAVRDEARTNIEQGASKTIEYKGAKLTLGTYSETKELHMNPKSVYSIECEFPETTPHPFQSVHFAETKVGQSKIRGMILQPRQSDLEIHITCKPGEEPKGVIWKRNTGFRYEPTPMESEMAEKLMSSIRANLTFENLQEQAMDAISKGFSQKV